VAQWERTRLSIGGVRVRIPSVPLAITLGFCSSLVERLVEAQRAAGSIPAEAILGKHAAVAERQTRDAQNVVGWARESSSLSGGMRCRVAQRESGGLISRDGRGFESHPCNPAPVAQLAERPPRKREVVGSEPTRSPGSGVVADWYGNIQVRSSTGRARDCGPRGGGSTPPHLIDRGADLAG
jgi:hypothetical protein